MLKREWFCLCACRQAEAATDEVYAQVSLVPDSEVLLSSHYFFFKCHFYFKCSAVVFFFSFHILNSFLDLHYPISLALEKLRVYPRS